MSNMNETEVLEIDVATGEVIRRVYTDEERADREELRRLLDELEAERTAKAAARAAALEKLGLSFDEAAALFGI